MFKTVDPIEGAVLRLLLPARMLLGAPTAGGARLEDCGCSYPDSSLGVSATFEGVAGGFTAAITTPGRHAYTLTPSQSCARVDVDFRGDGVILDNLSVCLTSGGPGPRCCATPALPHPRSRRSRA